MQKAYYSYYSYLDPYSYAILDSSDFPLGAIVDFLRSGTYSTIDF